MTPSSRLLLHLVALLCVGAVGIALISQHLFDMPPCAWCVLQRLLYLAIAVVCWVCLGVGTRTFAQVAAVLSALIALAGVAAAWYQHDVASHMFSCDQTFADRFMVQSGLDAALPWLFGIYATCMDARVTVLGMEYALWSLVLFACLVVLSLRLLRRA